MKYWDRDEGLIKGYSWHESFDAIATALEVISEAENLYEINKWLFGASTEHLHYNVLP